MVRDGFKKGRNFVPIETNEYTPKKHLNIAKVILVLSIVILLVVLYFIFKHPTVELIGDKIQQVPYNTKFVDSGIIATYHGKDITNKVTSTNNVDTNSLGEYQVIYEIPYWFGVYKYHRQVVVVDNEAPTITLVGEQELKLSYKDKYKELGFTAIDNCDGDLSDKVERSVTDITDLEKEIHYKVTDNSGNSQDAIRKINFIDNVKPEIEIEGEGTIFLEVGETYNEQGAKANDEIDGDLNDKIEISGEVDTNKEGIYNLTYSVADNSGNNAVVTREVRVGKLGKSAMNVGNPGVIYLTFDDGPTTSITPHILDILKQKGVKATFFIINYNSNTESLVKRIVEEGHTIAIHGGSHEYSKVYSSAESYLSGIDSMKEKIKKTTGVETNIVRFPGGSSNTVSRKYCKGVMTTLTNEVIKRGYRYFDWNVASGDSGDVHTAKAVYKNVTKGLKNTRSNVVLMHDFGGNTKTVEALPNIIDYGLKNGYTFDKITDKTPMVTQNVAN